MKNKQPWKPVNPKGKSSGLIKRIEALEKRVKELEAKPAQIIRYDGNQLLK